MDHPKKQSPRPPRHGIGNEPQMEFDDSEFLASLTPLMRWRYERLDAMVDDRLEKALRGKEQPLLLDVGCGRLGFLEHLEKGPRPPWRYLGVEPSLPQLRNRAKGLSPFGLVRATGENLPLPDMCAEAVLLKEVLDHSGDAYRLLKEAYRVLRPGGAFVLTVTNDRSYYKRLMPKENARRKERQTDHQGFYGPDDLRILMKTAPFDSVRIETYNYLKLPSFMERALGVFGPVIGKSLLALADRVGKTFLPGSGGGLLVSARRPSR